MKHVLPELRLAWLWVLLGTVLLLVIIVACLLPGQAMPDMVGSDKLKHFLAFGLLAFWFGSILVRSDLLWVGISVVVIGGLIELLQGAMGLGREPEWLDLGADALGVLLGLVLAMTPLGRWPRWFEALFAKVAR